MGGTKKESVLFLWDEGMLRIVEGPVEYILYDI